MALCRRRELGVGGAGGQQRNRLTDFRGDTLYIWCYSAESIAAADLPFLQLEDEQHDFTVPVKLETGDGDIPAKRWFQLRLPLSEFETASIHPFEARQLHSLYFSQGADDKPHTLIIDEIKIDDRSAASPLAPELEEAFLDPPRMYKRKATTVTSTLVGIR